MAKSREKKFFEIKIDLQLRFDIKNVLTITKNDAYATRHHICIFLGINVYKIECQMALK
jgi:hypothetical protein